jgi:hypothetical protein
LTLDAQNIPINSDMRRVIRFEGVSIPHSIYQNTQDLDSARTTGK